METLKPAEFTPRAPGFVRALGSYAIEQAKKLIHPDVSLGKSDIDDIGSIHALLQKGMEEKNSLVLVKDGTNQNLHAFFRADTGETYVLIISNTFDPREEKAGKTDVYMLHNTSVSLSSAEENNPPALVISGNSATRRREKIEIKISPDGRFLPAIFKGVRAPFPPNHPIAY